MVVDCASDKRYDATASANVEVSGARPKSVLREERLVTNLNDEFRVAMGGPSSSVLDAKSAAADPDRDLRSIARPTQREANVSAVTLSFDPHETAPKRLALQGTAQLLANSTKGEMPDASYGVISIPPMFALTHALYICRLERDVWCT